MPGGPASKGSSARRVALPRKWGLTDEDPAAAWGVRCTGGVIWAGDGHRTDLGREGETIDKVVVENTALVVPVQIDVGDVGGSDECEPNGAGARFHGDANLVLIFVGGEWHV